jgi:hypothetical protein
VAGVEIKNGIGKTGVALRYHSREDYQKLTDEQKKELKEFRVEQRKKRKTDGKQDDHGKGSKKQRKSFQKQLISALKELAEEKDSPSEEEADNQALLVSALQEIMATKESKAKLPPAPPSQPVQKPTSKLNSILKRLRSPKNA